jgi:hypothetical protein
MRMGDAATNPQFQSKTLPFSFYYQLFALIRRICSRCVFSVFTSVQNEAQRALVESFQQGLTRLHQETGALVNLFVDEEYTASATEDALDSLAHMVSAEVLVTARRSFSHVAGLLNPNCVVFLPTSRREVYLPGWVVLPLDRKGQFSLGTQPGPRKDRLQAEYLGRVKRGLGACMTGL